jgi:nitroreductase
MINPTIECIKNHGSIREYKPDPVDRTIIETIVECGQRASTSLNLQMYSVVVTTEPGEKEKLQEFCGDQVHISQAPVFLTWCSDLSRLERICQNLGYQQQSSQVENFILAVVDTAIAAQNAGLAAESLGLGFCYIGAIRNYPRKVIKLLGLPDLVFPLVGMTLGWPVSKPTIRPRLPQKTILHWGRYSFKGESTLLSEYDRQVIETGIYNGRQESSDKIQKDSSYGWMEHSARRVSQVLRPHLREVFEEIGFKLQ